MCLQLASKTVKSKKATKDIVCYKRLRLEEKIDLTKYINGASFKGIIKGIECEGHINIEIGRMYFCTDNDELDGSDCYCKRGHLYSWVYDYRVTEINGEKPILTTLYTTIYQNFLVKIGETYTSPLEKIGDTIGPGLHSYADVEKAYIFIHKGEVMVKCIIPKGASYYKGTYEGGTSYASDTLTYVELI